jgi:hypothetical protein
MEHVSYKGHNIPDSEMRYRYQTLDKFSSDSLNSFEFTSEDLNELNRIVAEKEAELKERGYDEPTVYLMMSGRNSNGDYEEENFTVELVWKETETKEEREYRILRAMEDIDEEIEREERNKKFKEELYNSQVANSIKILQEAGYKVEKK